MTKRCIAKETPSRMLAISESVMSNLCFFKLHFQNHSLYFEKMTLLVLLNLEISTLLLKMSGRKRSRSLQKRKRKETIRRNINDGEEYSSS